MKLSFRALVLLACFSASGLLAQGETMTLSAAEPGDEQTLFFEKEIRPALIKHCYQCHSKEGDKIKGGLLLDTRDATHQGGDSGPAVVPGNLNESLLYTAIAYEDTSLEMPPKYKLDDDTIAAFRKWIEMGAPDPRVESKDEERPVQSYTNTIDIEEGKKHWAYQVPMKPTVPETEASRKWASNEIDHFLFTRLAEEGLEPAPDADAFALYRRLSFDLIGLPPRIKASLAFAEAYAEDPDAAVAEAVDRFLATEQFGERWGRHWLDVARYAESSGKELNALFPEAWRYRDYVIDSFNRDKPFDQFITEQIAGDLLEADSPEQQGEQLIATGFLAMGTKGLNEQNTRQFRFDVVDEQIDTTTQAFLATTVSCARCHDHKFDPIPMSDYYSMAGIFLSSETLFGTARNQQNRRATELVSLPAGFPAGGPDKSLAEMIDLEFRAQETRDEYTAVIEEARQARQAGDSDAVTRARIRTIGIANRLGATEAQLALYDDEGRRIPRAMGVRESGDPFDSQILIRGEEDNATEERAPRGFVQVIRTNDEQPIPDDESGRLQLAQWIVSPENPLTARVFVNRTWLWLFGEGIVRSVDNFGTTGDAPTHPELLDFLAVRFHEHELSVKDLIREIATSRAYRMSSTYREDFFVKDPENRLLWRAHPRRLDAESIRDAVLAISGRLELDPPSGSVISRIGNGYVGRNVSEEQIDTESNHRSVYLPIVRDLLPESLHLFDFADPNLISGKREVTTVPSQALYLMNSEFALQSADAMTRLLIEDWELRGPRLGSTAFFLAYSRPPTEEEKRKTSAYFTRFHEVATSSGIDPEQARLLALSSFCQALFSSAEFRYLH